MLVDLTAARRLRGIAGRAAPRQVFINPALCPPKRLGRVSCFEQGMEMKSSNRRESDRIPFGVECAMPWAPAPSPEAQRPKPKRNPLRTLGLLLLTLAFLLGAWQLGRGIYAHFKAPVAQETVGKKA